jgi:hypothetical protein
MQLHDARVCAAACVEVPNANNRSFEDGGYRIIQCQHAGNTCSLAFDASGVHSGTEVFELCYQVSFPFDHICYESSDVTPHIVAVGNSSRLQVPDLHGGCLLCSLVPLYIAIIPSSLMESCTSTLSTIIAWC